MVLTERNRATELCILDAAQTLLLRGWCQRADRVQDLNDRCQVIKTCVCLSAALTDAAGKIAYERGVFRDLLERVSAAIRAKGFPLSPKMRDNPTAHIVSFNDRAGTTLEDVIAVCETTRAGLLALLCSPQKSQPAICQRSEILDDVFRGIYPGDGADRGVDGELQ